MAKAEINGIELEYSLAGDGEPLLMLPGLGTGQGYYRLVAPELSRQFTTILVDPRGIGGSKSDDLEFSAEQWADDFAALVDHLALSSVHVIGSSHGGCMAMAMADRHADKIATLSLIGGFSELDELMRLNFEHRIDLVGQLGLSETIGNFIVMWIMSHRYLETEAGRTQAAATVDIVKRNDPVVYKALCLSILAWGRRLPGQENEPLFTEKLRAFNIPSIAITGDEDHFIPADLSKIIAEALPGCEYKEINECGHIPVIEKPTETVSALTEFLKRHPIS